MKIKNKFINDHLAQLVTCAIIAFFLCFIINLPLYRPNFYTINLRWPLINAIEGGWSDNREFATNFVSFIEGTLIMMLGLVVGQRFLPENKMNFKQLLLFSFGAGLLRSLFYSFIPETYLHISRLYKLKSILEFVLFIVYIFAAYHLFDKVKISASAVKRSYYPSFKIIAILWFIADTALTLVIMNFLDFANISQLTVAGVIAAILTGAPYSALYTWLYFLPYLHANKKGHQQTRAIYILNIFAGWTILAWIIALIWSCTIPSEKKVIHQTVQTSCADELFKYKELLDAGVISQEEFENKKQQLLESR